MIIMQIITRASDITPSVEQAPSTMDSEEQGYNPQSGALLELHNIFRVDLAEYH